MPSVGTLYCFWLRPHPRTASQFYTVAKPHILVSRLRSICIERGSTMKTTGLLPVLALLFVPCGIGEEANDAPKQKSPWEQLWHNPKIRPWQDYPFVEKPADTLHKELWRNFDERPEWAQRGRLVYKHLSGFGKLRPDAGPEQIAACREKAAKWVADGVSLIHKHYPPHPPIGQAEACVEFGLNLVTRLDGKHFFGNDDIWRVSVSRGGVSPTTAFVPNHDWYRKFPQSLAANAVLRDGQLSFEYYGQKATQRRTANYMHPATIQLRDAFLRESLLGEQIFDIPLEPGTGGFFSGVWFDNPNNQVPSFDPYSRAYVAKEFRKRFGERYAGKKNEQWYSDPPHFWIMNRDREVLEWWEDLWADAHAGYYAWQYKFLQEEVAPKLGRKHFFVGGNFKLATPRAAWDYYAFSWPIADVLGPGESGLFYSDKHAVGYKAALAASNGKPGALWHGNELQAVEAMACLGLSNFMRPHLIAFQRINSDLYHNAKPGGRVAYLYHLKDGIHHHETANMCRLADQLWRAGVPFETVTERHLTPEVLSTFAVVIVPGFKFDARDIGGLKAYLADGGKLLLIGDNRDVEGKSLAKAMAGLDPLEDGEKAVGKGTVRHHATQLVSQQQMNAAMVELGGTAGWRLLQPEGANILINATTQPRSGLAACHLVNFTGEPVKDLGLKLPAGLDTPHLALITPYGGESKLEVKDGTVSVPELSLYAVVVAAPDEETQQAIVARNAKQGFEPHDGKYPGLRMRGNLPTAETKLEALKPGDQLCHLRQVGRCNLRRVAADLITKGTATVGQPLDIQMTIHRVGVHVPAYVHFDKVNLVMIRESDGHRESVPVEMKLEEGESQAEVSTPAATFVRRVTTTQWTPKEPGLYQLYLSYRYVSEAFEGKPDPRPRYDDFFWSVPLRRMVYEDRLPCLRVVVKGP